MAGPTKRNTSSKGKFRTTEDYDGSVTITRRGSAYDTGRHSGNSANASTNIKELKEGRDSQEVIKSSKRFAKNSKKMFGEDKDQNFFVHTQKDMK
jgi:hypothetical protein